MLTGRYQKQFLGAVGKHLSYLSEVVVLHQLLLRNKRKLLNGRFNKTDYYSSGKKVGEGGDGALL